MDELFPYLLIALVLITLVGHGIWSLLAFLVRRLRRWSEGGEREEAAGKASVSRDEPPLGGSRDVALRELDVAARRVSWLWEAGFLERSTSGEISRAIARARVSLGEGRDAVPDIVDAGVEARGPAAGETSRETARAPGEEVSRPVEAERPPPLPEDLSAMPGEHARGELHRDAGPREEEAEAAVGPARRGAAPTVPAERRSLADTLTVFMERKNIRWFELIGGLLVVASSGALVLNLWSHIREDLVLKFALVTGVTACLFGVGLYAERRWKLPATSRGILILASLLVPLDFLALIAFSLRAPADAALIAGEVTAAILFLALSWSAGRAIARPFALLYALGVVGPSVAMLILRRAVVSGAGEPALLLLGGLPLALCLATAAGSILIARRWRYLGRLKAYAFFAALGVSFFAASLSVGLLAYFLTSRMEVDVRESMRAVGLHVLLLGVPGVASGTFLARRLSSRRDPALTIAATSVAAAGVLVSLASVVFSWPDPVGVLAAAAACAVILSVFAFLAPFPDANFLAGLCGILAYLLGFHLVVGDLAADVGGRELADALFSGKSGNALIIPVVLFGALGLGLRARGHDAHGRSCLAVGVVALFLGAALAAGHGFAVDGDPLGVTWTFSAYSLASFAGAWALRERRIAGTVLAAFGTALLLGALIQVLVFRIDPALRPERPLLTAFLLHVSATVIPALVLRRSARSDLGFLEPVLRVSSGLTILGASLILAPGLSSVWFLVSPGEARVLASRTLWLGLAWLGMAFLFRAPLLVSLAQLGVTVAAATFALSVISGKAWFAPRELAHPWSLQTIGIAVGLVQLAASIARQALVPRLPPAAREVLGAPAARIDKLLLVPVGMILVLLLGAGFDAALRGREIAAEFFGAGSWLLWGVLIAALVASARERSDRLAIYSLLAALWLVCFLVAGQGAGGGWILPGLQWSLAIFFLVAAGLLGSRPLLGRLATGEWAWLSEPRSRLAIEVRRVLTGLGILPLAILSILCLLSLGGSPPELRGACFVALGPALAWALPALFVSLGLLAGGVVLGSRAALTGAWVVLGLAGAAGYVMHYGALEEDTLWPFARELFAVIASVGSAAGLVVLACERTLTRESEDLPIADLRYLSLVAASSIVVALAGFGLVGELAGGGFFPLLDSPVPPVFWVALTAAALLAGTGGILHRDERSWRALFALVIAGAVAAIDALGFRQWAASGCLALAFGLSGLAAGGLGRFGSGRLSRDAAGRADLREFFLRSSVALSIPVALLSVWMALFVGAPELGGSGSEGKALLVRLFAAAPVIVSAAGILAALPPARPGASGVWSLNLASLAPVVLTWAWIEPGGGADRLLHRTAALIAWSAAAGWAFGIGALRPPLAASPWKDAFRRALLCQTSLFAAFLLVSLGLEAFLTLSDSETGMHSLASLAVSLACLAVAAGLVVSALLPGGGPFDLAERRAPLLVYLSEGALAVGFAHLRLTMPWLFGGFFTRYWPFVVMGLAYLAVALGAFLRRRGPRTLSGPLDRTGLYLPLAPILGFFLPSEADTTVVLLLAALLYAGLSLARRSFALGVVAALAASGTLWHFYLEFDRFTFIDYPQLWVVPLPLSVLIASYVHRREIPPERLAALRYACLGFIYLTSTAEIFIDGVAASPWLPLLLAFWSVLGVVVGAAARVRSFLFTGSAFLLIAMTAMVWHASAALGWDWLWYVAGIVLGLAIIASIAFFEKKRADALRLLGGLKNWER